MVVVERAWEGKGEREGRGAEIITVTCPLTSSSMRVLSCGTRGLDRGFDSKYSVVKKT